MTERSEWSVWGTTASIVVTDGPAVPGTTGPSRIERARRIADEELERIGRACDRFDPGSELSRVQRDPRLADGVEVSPVLARLIDVALIAAAETGGCVDPTLGGDLMRLGYDRDLSELERDGEDAGARGASVATVVGRRLVRRPADWRSVTLAGTRLSVADGLVLDLGATAKAFAADLIAHRVAAECGGAVLVCLGGDIATAGRRDVRWEVLVQDLDDDPAQQVSIGTGTAVATSSTQKRRWTRAGVQRHHILDPEFGMPVPDVWRSVTVAASTCVRANALSTAALVHAGSAAAWLRSERADARLVTRRGDAVSVGAWPADGIVASHEAQRALRGAA